MCHPYSRRSVLQLVSDSCWVFWETLLCTDTFEMSSTLCLGDRSDCCGFSWILWCLVLSVPIVRYTCKLTVFVVHWRHVFLISTRHIERIRGAFCDDALYKLTFTLRYTATGAGVALLASTGFHISHKQGMFMYSQPLIVLIYTAHRSFD